MNLIFFVPSKSYFTYINGRTLILLTYYYEDYRIPKMIYMCKSFVKVFCINYVIIPNYNYPSTATKITLYNYEYLSKK